MTEQILESKVFLFSRIFERVNKLRMFLKTENAKRKTETRGL